MTPTTIIKAALTDGVSLALSPRGTIKVSGDEVVVTRWLPIIREHKPAIVTALQQAANDDTISEPAVEARQERVLKMLRENPSITYAMVADTESDADAVALALAIRGKGTCEILIPRERYDGLALLDLIERHGATVH